MSDSLKLLLVEEFFCAGIQFNGHTIPAKTYNKVETDTAAVAVKCMLAVTDKMDADTGYAVVKALYGNLDRMKAAHNVSKNITKETGKDGMSIKLNAGAEKFFNEK